ncbi:MAG: hypothetical protein QOE58_438 [Actinomycetota bacterium]|nr:hypothetical protein [Actinomycetota bacterium]
MQPTGQILDGRLDQRLKRLARWSNGVVIGQRATSFSGDSVEAPSAQCLVTVTGVITLVMPATTSERIEEVSVWLPG